MLNHIMRFVNGEEGATAPEYGLMVALIAAFIIVSVQALGGAVATTFTNVAATILGS